jgi:hypothetical protein
MNGVSIRYAPWPYILAWLEKAQHRDHAYAKPLVRNFRA